MKKILVIALLLVYGFSSTGMTLQLHYCCGKLKSVELAPVKDPGCGSKHKMGSKPCCETKNINAKSKADQDNYRLVYKIANPSAPVLWHGIEPGISLNAPDLQFTPHLYASPPLLSRSLFLLNKVFRI
ncbi:MAG TPA: hypothetical protein VJ499_02655 [Flavisolibacter sp.]|nr:hypothetical protein [Flavisolibacter sp.]